MMRPSRIKVRDESDGGKFAASEKLLPQILLWFDAIFHVIYGGGSESNSRGKHWRGGYGSPGIRFMTSNGKSISLRLVSHCEKVSNILWREGNSMRRE